MGQAYDFTTGSIPKKMVLFSVPIFLGNVLQSSYQFIDSLWVGNLLGSLALAAIAVSGPIIFTVLSFIIGVNGATLTVLSQHKGAGDEAGLKQSLNAFVVVLGGLSLILGAAGYVLSGWLLKLLSTPDSVYPLALTYLKFNFLGIPFLFGYNFISTILRALGNSKAPMRFIGMAVILNTVFDPLFIYVLQLGIAGAAFATVLSQGAAFVYGLIFSIRKANVPYTLPRLPKWRYLKALIKLGIPSGLQMVVISGGTLAVVGVVSQFGDVVLAGYGAAGRIGDLIMIAPMALGSAVTSMAGQNIGAVKWDRVSQVVKSGTIVILIATAVLSTFVFFAAEMLIGWFVDDEATIAFGAAYLAIVSYSYLFLGVNFVLNGAVRASGAMFQVLVLNFVSFWVLRFPLVYLFSKWYGANGIGVGMGTSFVISSLVAMLYYRFGKWRQTTIFDDERSA